MPHRRWSVQLIWLIPILAALIGGWLAVKAVLDRGSVITITFQTAEGIEVDKTRIKYRNVDIGRVTAVAFSDDRSRVVVTAELSKQANPLLVDGTRFWVVRPRVSLNQVSGLGTLLSGAYIGVDVGHSEKSVKHFTGLDQPPAITVDRPGSQYVLRARDLGSLDVGSPVFFRRVQVGQLIAHELDADGQGVTLRIFVNAPYDRYVTADTRFWQASGVDVSLDASGLSVSTESLASMLVGGIAFQAPRESAALEPAPAASEFPLYADRGKALRLPDTAEETYTVHFSDSVRGLSVGAPVDFRGVVIGEVVSIDLAMDPAAATVRVPVVVRVYPDRLGGKNRPAGKTGERGRILEQLVARGLRAQLRSGSLLTGQLYVALDFFPEAPPGKLLKTAHGVEMPTLPGSLQALQETLLAVAKKLEKLPLEAVSADLRRTLQAAEQTLVSTDGAIRRVDQELLPKAVDALAALDQTLARVTQTLAHADRLLSDNAPVQQDLRETLREVARAAAALRSVADYLERNPSALLRGRSAEAPTNE